MSSEFNLSKDARIYIAGHKGLVGSALWRHFSAQGFSNLIGWGSKELDLRDQGATLASITRAQPEIVIMAAAKVGGIVANSTCPVEFLNENLRIQTNVFEAAQAAGVDRLLFLGSSCIYPKFADQPIKEDSLLTGPLEPTNEAYAIAKIAGVLQVQAYRREYGRNWISAMPTNLYGLGDNFDLETSHVIPAMLRKFHEAKVHSAESVTMWGSGTPRREFLHVDDLAAACLHLLQTYNEPEPINVGWGEDITIKELSEMISEVAGYEGEIIWDNSKPDGTPRKLLDTSRIKALGWGPKIMLRDGLAATMTSYLKAQG